ncbi:unnamed protein product [Candida verbasci]|uniref:Zn(2)-C6 fungal-type domain-containing protein n=1 Tax=Candida verbasci TaxID=1227364 RepID=A0A9W4U131_9ASCO|nr:unnamed protein product [Candida verbasci]
MMSTASTSKEIPSINTMLKDTGQPPLTSLSSSSSDSILNRTPSLSNKSSPSLLNNNGNAHLQPKLASPSNLISISPLLSSSSPHTSNNISPTTQNININTNSSAHANNSSCDPPRKRSKISRACDSCRRKKVKCNADYSQALQKVTKICTNCEKNKEDCLFSRTPLKRGPSKGYIRELEEKVDINNKKPPTNEQQQQQQQQQQQLHNKPLPFPQQSTSSKSSIILPPLVGYATSSVPQKLSPTHQSSNPSSPRTQQHSISGLLNNENTALKKSDSTTATSTNSPPIQGPFWKVPYELPQSSLSRKSSITSISSANNNDNTLRRRSSIDSISSTSTNGSRLPSIKPMCSNDYITDSESEDYYSVKSYNSRPVVIRSNSQSLSPRNSITSLSSLNNRVNQFLNITPTPSPNVPYQQHIPPPQQQHQFQQLQVPPPQAQFLPPINPLDLNLKLYYEHFHSAFPILPFNSNLIIDIIKDSNSLHLQDWLVELFNISLNNLMNFKLIPISQSINLFQRLIQAYPIESPTTSFSNSSLIFYLSSLVLISYTLMLNGDSYNQSISVTNSILNDYRVIEKFINYNNQQNNPDLDNIVNYFMKLYYLLNVIDGINSLQLGQFKNINIPNNFNSFINSKINTFLPKDDQIIKVNQLLNLLIENQHNLIFNQVSKLQVPPQVESSNTIFTFFNSFIIEKNQVINYIYELKSQLTNSNFDNDDLLDCNVTLIRHLKKFTNSILSFSNQNVALFSPILNIAICQLFKNIKFIKLVIENIKCNNEMSKRLDKINNDLSISFNLLTLNIVNLKIGNKVDLILKQKLQDYNLQFNKVENKTVELNDWINCLNNVIIPFVNLDNQGWL